MHTHHSAGLTHTFKSEQALYERILQVEGEFTHMKNGRQCRIRHCMKKSGKYYAAQEHILQR
ncbi:hypothetical protein, partial [Citrobacter sp. wls621]|uniref:hypothetical protein n=1 Tax=Citrobacter sp. wls621 TaxID=2576430 RepID=UPI001BAF0484